MGETFAQAKSLEVEIGFGNGEYLARLAQSVQRPIL